MAVAKCGYRTYLEKVVKLPAIGTWWFVGGRAFAAFKEEFEREVAYEQSYGLEVEWPTVEWARLVYLEHFAREIENAVVEGAGHPDTWLAAGGKEDGAWWSVAGPGMAELYVQRNPPSRPFKTWTTPDGALALEVEIELQLGDRMVSGRLDHITIDDAGYVDIQDEKSGSSLPQDPYQLELYAVLVKRAFGVDISRLHYYHARPIPDRSVRQWLVTRQWDPTRTAAVIDRAERTAKQLENPDALIPVVSNMCKACPMRRHCAFGGTATEVL